MLASGFIAGLSLLVQSAAPQPATEAISVTRALVPLMSREQRFLRGAAHLSIPVQLPLRVRPTSGVLSLDLAFIGYMMPQSNVRVLINGRRRDVFTRREADSHGRATMTVPLTRADVSTGSINLELAAGIVTGADRCADESQTLSGVELQPGSRMELTFSAPTETDRVAATMFADTVLFRAPTLPLSGPTFDSLLFGLTQFAYRAQTPLVSWIAPGGLDVQEVMSLQPPRRHAVILNPDVRELDHSALAQDFSRTAEWRFSLDERTLPAGHIPERLILKMVVADNAADRLLKVTAYLNGVYLRDAEVLQNGTRRTIRLYLPPEEIQIYNEVTLIAARPTVDWGNCNEAPVTHPAQLQDDGYLHMATAHTKPDRIAELVALLPDTFDLLVPVGTLRSPQHLLHLAVQGAQALWGPSRRPRTRVYDSESAIRTTRPSIVFIQTAERRTTVRVSHEYGSPALVIALAQDATAIPVGPEMYSRDDSVSFTASGVGSPPKPPSPKHFRDPLAFARSGAVWIALIAALLTFIALVRQRYDSRLVET